MPCPEKQIRIWTLIIRLLESNLYPGKAVQSNQDVLPSQLHATGLVHVCFHSLFTLLGMTTLLFPHSQYPDVIKVLKSQILWPIFWYFKKFWLFPLFCKIKGRKKPYNHKHIHLSICDRRNGFNVFTKDSIWKNPSGSGRMDVGVFTNIKPCKFVAEQSTAWASEL